MVRWLTHWSKNPQFIPKFTFSKSHNLRNSHFHNHIFSRIHIFEITFCNKNCIFKIAFFTKNHISVAHFSLKSHFQIHIFHNNLIFKVIYSTKITFSKSHLSQKAHFWGQFFTKVTLFLILSSSEFMDKKCDFAPVWLTHFPLSLMGMKKKKKKTAKLSYLRYAKLSLIAFKAIFPFPNSSSQEVSSQAHVCLCKVCIQACLITFKLNCRYIQSQVCQRIAKSAALQWESNLGLPTMKLSRAEN